MVEGRCLPTRRRVALAAGDAILAVVDVILAVTGDALGRKGQLCRRCGMAGRTGNHRVTAGQAKAGLAVVELHDLP